MSAPASESQAPASPLRGAAGSCALAVGITAVALVGLFWPSLPALHHRWTQGFSYTHGYLVLGMAVWLGVYLFRRTGSLTVRPWWLAIAPLALGSIALAAAQLVGIDVAQQLAMPAIAWLAVAAVAGRQVALRAAPAFAFVYFAIPAWDVFVRPLQELTTLVVGLMLEFNSFPVVIEGFRVSVPAGEFEVAGGCSGLHFVVVGLTIAVFYGATEMRTWRGRALALLLALGLSLLTNWVRVYTLVLVGQLSQMQHYLITTDHYLFGWIVFAVAILAFFVIVRRFEPAPPDDRMPLSLYVRPGVLTAAAVAAIVMLAPAAAAMMLPGAADTSGYRAWPAVGADWTLTSAPQPAWRPVQSDNAVTAEGRAVSSGQALDWYIAWYPVQENNRELIAWGNRPYAAHLRAVSTASRDGYRLAEVVTASGSGRLVAWRQRVAGEPAYGRLQAKLAQLAGLLRGDRSAELAAVSTACRGSCDDEREAFEAAARRWFDALHIETSTETTGVGDTE